MRQFARLRGDQRGAVALWTALMAFMLFGIVGAGLDFGRSIATREAMRNYADGMAIQLATNTTPASYPAQTLSATGVARNDVQELAFTAQWVSPTDMQVVGTGKVRASLIAAVPGMDKFLNVGVRALARVNIKYVSKQPQMTALDPEAADYNQLFLYCFEPAGITFPSDGSKPAGIEGRRTQMTKIADNKNGPYPDFTMPTCGAGQNLSVRLRNVRDALADPTLWESSSAEQYNWYSDVTLDQNGVPQYHFEENVAILETYNCNSMSECQPQSSGGSGIIATGKRRTPNQASAACKPGQYVYYGFEDRPPGKGKTDRDYDDIRLVMQCPETTGSRSVFLVQ